ncbi:unnamed protein product, partial [Choristocarpus tenellus]
RRKWAWTKLLLRIVYQPPYLYHSLERALDRGAREMCDTSESSFIIGMMAEYHFDLSLRMDSRLRAMYRCFEGAAENRVDYRDILCCMRLLRRGEVVRENPRRILYQFLEMYVFERRFKLIRRRDVLRVQRMAAISKEQIQQTSGRLDRYLTEAAVRKGIKPGFRSVPIAMLLEVIEDHPVVLKAFQEQIWQCLSEKQRLGILDATEDARLIQAGYGVMSMKYRRASRWHTLVVYRWIVKAWIMYLRAGRQANAQRKRMLDKVQRIALLKWHMCAGCSHIRRRHSAQARCLRRRITQRRYFYRILKMVTEAKRVRSLTWRTSKKGKLVCAGMGIIRAVFRKKCLRLALHAWCEIASLMTAWDFAVNLSKERLCGRIFSAMRDLVQVIVTRRRLEDTAEKRAADFAAAVQQAEEEGRMLKDAVAANEKRQRAAQKAKQMADRGLANKLEMKEKQEQAAQREKLILDHQRQARRQRVYEEGIKLEKEFNEVWEKKLPERVDADMKEVAEWITSKDPEAKFKLEKELQVLKRKYYAPPLPETIDLERALRDPANAVFAHMAHKLYEKNLTLHEFFNQYDKEGDGYLAHEEFKGMVASLNINMTGEQVRSVIRSIDLDGGGFIDFPELEMAVKRHEEVCGAAGSAWKMYVNPVHAIMTLHNIKTNEEIWDYKATDKDLLRVVYDTIVGMEGIKAREASAVERAKNWDQLQQERAALVLQRQYHVWVARKKRALVRWKWDLGEAQDKARKLEQSAIKIQCWWRVRMAKLLAVALVHITIEVLCDPGLRKRYYFNHSTNTSSWKPPFMLRGWLGPGADLPKLPEWVYISRLYGQVSKTK